MKQTEMAICTQCGKLFVKIVYNKKYCSEECCALANTYLPKEWLKKGKCGYCEREFTKKQTNSKYCSKGCRDRFYEEKSKPLIKWGIQNCTMCKNSFEKTQANHKYCSSECRKVAVKKNRDL